MFGLEDAYVAGADVIREKYVKVATNIGVGTQSTLGGHQIFARKICIINQQNARILHDFFARKMPEFYVIIARKIFFPNLF